ncbi:MAG: PH domain-containing protein [Planctomycetaceae bacterium]
MNDIDDRGALAGSAASQAAARVTHRVYPSAVDRWLIAILYAGPALLIGLCIYLSRTGRSEEALTCLLVSAGLVLLNLVLTLPCRYTLTADALHIRCGLIRETIELQRITHAELSSSWRSGPALSLKRVRIHFGECHRLISPLDRERFIQDLMEAVQHAAKARPIGRE